MFFALPEENIKVIIIITNTFCVNNRNTRGKGTINEKRETEVIVETENELVTIQNDWVIAPTGYQANSSFLEKEYKEVS